MGGVKDMFKIICECGGISEIVLVKNNTSNDITVTGDVYIDCGDWFIDNISCSKCEKELQQIG